jgi:Kef-type K+ transport system membrane component KefB
MITAKLILDILLILIVAWFFGSLFTRFGLPVMLARLSWA